MTLKDLAHEYAPYHTMPEFTDGFDDYVLGTHLTFQEISLRYRGAGQQAYDRGAECAMRWERLQWERERA